MSSFGEIAERPPIVCISLPFIVTCHKLIVAPISDHKDSLDSQLFFAQIDREVLGRFYEFAGGSGSWHWQLREFFLEKKLTMM